MIRIERGGYVIGARGWDQPPSRGRLLGFWACSQTKGLLMLTDELQAILEVLWALAPPQGDARIELEGCGLGPVRMDGAHCCILTTFGRLIIELSDDAGFPHHAVIAQYDRRLIAHLLPGYGQYRAIRRWRLRPEFDRRVLGTQQIDGKEVHHVRLTCKNRPPLAMDADGWLDAEGIPQRILFWLQRQSAAVDAGGKATPYDTWVTVGVSREPVDKQMFEIPANFMAADLGSGDVYNVGELMNEWKIRTSRIRS